MTQHLVGGVPEEPIRLDPGRRTAQTPQKFPRGEFGANYVLAGPAKETSSVVLFEPPPLDEYIMHRRAALNVSLFQSARFGIASL